MRVGKGLERHLWIAGIVSCGGGRDKLLVRCQPCHPFEAEREIWPDLPAQREVMRSFLKETDSPYLDYL